MNNQCGMVTRVLGIVGVALERARWQRTYCIYRKQYDIDPSFKFNGHGTVLTGNGTIQLGADSYIGRHSAIRTHEGGKVVIGRKCAISHYVMMYSQSRVADQDMSGEIMRKRGNIVIGDYCWIGAHVFINPGVTIGGNAVIGANSVVTHGIPDNCIAVGAPAKVVRGKAHLGGGCAGGSSCG